jgi:hypothetical protein
MAAASLVNGMMYLFLAVFICFLVEIISRNTGIQPDVYLLVHLTLDVLNSRQSVIPYL